jgi:hypothetical protein
MVAGVVGLAGAARAQLPVAPPPRPAGTPSAPAQKPEPQAKAEDPAAVVDRIIKNSKDVGERLEKTDTGTDTRSKQDKILSDIDALINRQDDPPPPKPDDKNDKKDMNDMPPPDKGDMPPKDKNDAPKDKGDMPKDKGDMPKDKGMGQDKKDKGMDKHDGMPDGKDDMPPMPMGGNGRKPRMGEPNKDDKKDQNDPPPMPMNDQKQPGTPKEPKNDKSPAGATAGNPGGKLPATKTLLPLEEGTSKDVWGHLPDKLRQQMTQYYNEDIMPRYAELLRLYYSSFAEAGGPTPAMPKK